MHILILPIVTSLAMGAGAFDTIFENGVTAYDNGDYAAAIAAFEKLIAEGVVEPAAFYNLGNAYYRAGRIGAAIANYERALQVQPNLRPARENLARAVSATERRLSKPAPPAWEQSLLFWHDSLTERTAYWCAATAWILLWTLLALRRFKPLRYMRRAAVIAFVLSAAFTASVYAKTHPQQLAVASVNRVPVHYGTSVDETVRFELYEGDRVLVDAREAGWARVITADGERGWAQSESLSFVGPPYLATIPAADTPEAP